jgi:hypothetical protein
MNTVDNNLPINKYNDEVCDFFGLPKIKINVHLIQSREEFDKTEGHKTADWVVGFTRNDTIYIFDKDKFEKYTSHPKSDFGPVLKHEISHIYYKQLSQVATPIGSTKARPAMLPTKKRIPLIKLT